MNTSKAKRINPNRILNTTQSGIKRIALSAPEAAENIPEVKPLRTQTKPKNFFLTVTHADRGMLDDHAHQVIASAAILADKETAVVALVLGELRENIASLGADKVMVRPEFDYQIFQPDAELACVLKVIDSLQPSRIFMPDNMIGDGELGRRLIATQPSKSVATHVIEIDAKHVASYQAGGSLLAYADLPDIILLAPNTAETNLPFIASAIPDEQLKSISYTFKESNSDYKDPYKNLGMLPVASATIALEEADFIVSAGNGVSNVETLETLAHSLDAAIGASRVAVDDGKFPRDKQIGASGKTVSASAYLAIGISGAVQHLQGIKDCRHVIAINRDNSAPIVKRADLTIIGDAEEIMQSLILAIAEAKQATSNQTISNPVS
jgi:electron transfer flavoprotein alpha subunit